MMSLPRYILNQTEFYNGIARGFISAIAKAKTESEYNAEFAAYCNRWKRELTDDNALAYFLQSGEFEPETVAEIKQYFVDHAEPFTKAVLEAGLKSGGKYTLVYLNDFGFPVADKITLDSVRPAAYAQYTDVVKMTFKRYKKRSFVEHYFYNKSLIVFNGWHDLKDTDTKNVVKNTPTLKTYMSKYSGFDSRYIEDLSNVFGEPLLLWKNYKIRESDGKIFA